MLPRVLKDVGRGPLPPGLRTKRSRSGTLFFALYCASLIAYITIRGIDMRAMPNWRERGYSLFILLVELIGVSALVPYGFANCAFTLPRKETEAEAAHRSWAQFGCTKPYDIFVLVPCYKESWSTIKRTLMAAMFARVPPGCRKHIILGNDGHDVENENCKARSGLLAKLVTDVRLMYPGREDWFYAIHESRRPKLRYDAAGQPLPGKTRRIAGNAKSLNLNHCEYWQHTGSTRGFVDAYTPGCTCCMVFVCLCVCYMCVIDAHWFWLPRIV
jgi:hypothetical protein